MPRAVIEYRCLLISPSDVDAERDALASLVHDWNAHIGESLGARVVLVRWETHAVPDTSSPPQQSVNQQIVDDSDFGIAVFWTRLGTETSVAPSGSVEEVKRLMARGARVLVYFSGMPVPQERLRDDQFQRLQAFKAEVQGAALLGSYSSLEDLRHQVQLHLTTVVAGLLQADRSQPSPEPSGANVLTASTPDVRVRVAAATVAPGPDAVEVLAITVQNHSPLVVYVASVVLILAGQRKLWAPRDFVTSECQRRRVLQPGESMTFMMSPDEVAKHSKAAPVEYAAAVDDIGREFRSSSAELAQALKDLKIDERAG